MRVGIICAGDKELAPFLPLLGECTVTEKAMLTFHESRINGVDVVALYSGVCKVNAAVAAQILIDTYRVDCIINAGVAGGMNRDLAIFDTVICTEVAHHDVDAGILTDFHPWMESVFFRADEKLLELSRKAVGKLEHEHRIVWGRMVTGEAFIADDGRQAIKQRFAPLTVDMETAAIAQVCYVNSIPFIAVRSITDTEDHSGTEHFEENCQKAAAIARDVTVALLEEIHNRETYQEAHR